MYQLEKNISYIKESFQNMKSKEEFLALLNYVKVLIYGDRTVPFELKHLNYHAHFRANRYTQFSIPKKSGAERIIHAPNKELKSIQRCLNLIFQTVNDIHPAATGFVPEKSIVDNALIHSGSLYVYNIDLKDFFPSIDQARVWGRLQHPPFNLNKQTDRLPLANLIAALCCHEMEVERLNENKEWIKVVRNVLPQGAPTSPTLTNIICQHLDFYLSAVAKRFGLRYSRYADDITFSCLHNVFQKDSDFLKEIHRIIVTQNFHIKESKTRLQKQGYRQEVTGLLVNDKPNVQKRYVKQVRMYLYYWETYGYDKAECIIGSPNLKCVLAGKLNFLQMVVGGENSVYLKLKCRYDRLTKVKYSNSKTDIKLAEFQMGISERDEHLNKVLTTLISNGVFEAMKQYNI